VDSILPGGPASTFLVDLGLVHRFGEDACVGEVLITPEMRVPGTQVVRTSALATFADVVAGSIANKVTFPRVCMTVDLGVRMLGPGTVAGVLELESRVLKTGRNTTFCETWFTADGGTAEPLAVSHSTFMASPRPEDVLELPPERVFPRALGRGRRLRRPFPDQLGCRVTEPGVAEIHRVPYVMNPAGTIQGGAIALLAELAAESLYAGGAGEGSLCVVADLDVRYLSAVRSGPARATARLAGGENVRVEVRDPGNSNRLTALAWATVVTAG
jgi:acyl-coenzyme A thioesterase PaaI-like protein